MKIPFTGKVFLSSQQLDYIQIWAPCDLCIRYSESLQDLPYQTCYSTLTFLLLILLQLFLHIVAHTGQTKHYFYRTKTFFMLDTSFFPLDTTFFLLDIVFIYTGKTFLLLNKTFFWLLSYPFNNWHTHVWMKNSGQIFDSVIGMICKPLCHVNA